MLSICYVIEIHQAKRSATPGVRGLLILVDTSTDIAKHL